ncbi:MAG: helix-turn-helix domain-containing protein [Pseudonocardiaceae bacterium]
MKFLILEGSAVASRRHLLIYQRKTVGLTQEQLAELLGVDRSTVIRWERGETWPQPWQRPRLAGILQVTNEELHDILLNQPVTPMKEKPLPVSDTLPSFALPVHPSNELAVPLLRQLSTLVSASWQVDQTPRQREAAYGQLVQVLVAWADCMKRREVLQILSSAASAAAAAPLFDTLDSDEQERLALAIQTPRRVDNHVIDHIEEVLYHCMRQDDALGPQAALDTVLAQRSLARVMLIECPSEHRARLLSVYANLSAYAGWLAFDLNDFDGASYYYEAARTDAHEAHDAELGALILCNMSHLATWRGRARVGIDHAVAAQVWARKTGNVALQAYACDRAARAFALDKQQSACFDEIDNAQAQLAAVESSLGNSLMYFYNDGLLANTKSLCLLALGDAKRAIAHAKRSLNLIDTSFVRNRAFSTLYLARAYIQEKKIDNAAALIGEAADLTMRNRSARLVDTVRSARSDVQPWVGTRTVAALDERLASYGLI